MTAAIEAQVERFAPGFRDRILARATQERGEMEAYDPNYVGGDINGGIQDFRQLLFRPTALDPYWTRAPGSGSARRRPRRAAASTGCAACMRPTRPCERWPGSSGPLIPPSLRIRQKWTARKMAAMSGRKMTCAT